MKIIQNLTQGSDAWHRHRATARNASDAPALMGASPYVTRSDLLKRRATGIEPEHDAATQVRFARGLEVEPALRAYAESIVGEDLYPIIATSDDGYLSASLDGVTLMGDTIFEAKQTNAAKVKAIRDGQLPEVDHWQVVQQFAVCDTAVRCIYCVGDGTPEGTVPLIVPRDSIETDIATLRAAWAQFDADLAAYELPDAPPAAPVAKVVASLPVVFEMRVEGKLIACNIEQYKPEALAYIQAINTDLTTDQHFADADADAKFCRESAAKLKLAREQAMGQMGDINAALNAVSQIAEAFDAKGLALEKLVKAEKDRRRAEIVTKPAQALRDHISALNLRIGKPLMPAIPADFAGVVKGLRNLSSMEDAVNTELARAKIAASEIADRIQTNLHRLNERADLAFLFPDIATIVLKAPDDLQALVANRISEHQAAEQKRLDEERERIRKEEQERADREARERQEAADAEAARQAQAAIATAATPAAAPVAAPAVVARPLQATPVAAQKPAVVNDNEKATMKLGDINARLGGISVTAEFLAELGFVAHVERSSKLYKPSAFPAICEALIQHITKVADGVVA